MAWSRGYILAPGLIIPGGATGILQGPDTDLHGWLEQELIALQELEQHARLLERPGKVPSETRQSMCDYAMTLWETADHRQGEMSFKRNGLNNDLSGREDHLISREARELWFALGMPSERKRVEVEVDMFLETLRTERAAVTESPADAILPEDVFQLIEDYPENVGPGEEREGEELLASDLAVLDEGDRSGSDESAVEDAAEEPAPSAEVAKGMAPDLEVKEPEVGLVSDLSRLEIMIAVAQGMDDPAILGALHVHREPLLRCVRRSDVGVAAAANAYREDARQKIREMQEAARLEDEALQRLKQAKHEARLFKAKSAKRRLVSEGPADVAPPAAGPAATVAFVNRSIRMKLPVSRLSR